MFKTIKDLALQIIKDSPNIPSEAQFAIKNIDSPTFLVNFISSNMNADVSKKQEMLEEMNLKTRVMKVLEHLSAEAQMLEMKNEIQNKVRKEWSTLAVISNKVCGCLYIFIFVWVLVIFFKHVVDVSKQREILIKECYQRT